MAGELLTVWNDAAIKTLEASGAQINNTAMSAAATNAYSVDGDGQGYPDGQFILKVTYAVAPIENGVICLCYQSINLDGADGDAPETGRPNVLGTFNTNNVITLQSLTLTVEKLPRNAKYYLYNVNTGQAIPAGWTLKLIPMTVKTAA